MLIESLKITSNAIIQSFILGLVGYFLIKRNILGQEGLKALSRLVLEITLPALILYRLCKDFDFSRYPDWWIYPLISVVISIIAIFVGFLFTGFIKDNLDKRQFLSLVSFQNSGYLPLVLIASLLPPDKADIMLIYLFLFLLGFNLLLFSLGVYILNYSRGKKFDWVSLFNPPVIATVVGLLMVFLNLQKFIPGLIIKPLEMVGDCTLPLSIFVVGGNLASIQLLKVDRKGISLLILVKLILLPLMGLWFVSYFRLPQLLGLLIVMQLAMPSATNLAVILNRYKKEDKLISQGIFYSHLFSLVTVPLFLSFYFARLMLK
ncbi:MAG: AEC family transporter [Candidatus Omnitrophota bacterium]